MHRNTLAGPAQQGGGHWHNWQAEEQAGSIGTLQWLGARAGLAGSDVAAVPTGLESACAAPAVISSATTCAACTEP